VEGRRNGEWILLDYVDFVIHVFLDEKRAFYDIERLRKSARPLTPAEFDAELTTALAEKTRAVRSKTAAAPTPQAKRPAKAKKPVAPKKAPPAKARKAPAAKKRALKAAPKKRVSKKH
jgi:ribosome-associated protein